MKPQKKLIKFEKNKILVGICFISLCLPLVQTIYPIIDSYPLRGSFTKHPCPKISDTAWFNGSFQKALEKYLSDEVGFKPDFVRLKNQIDFSFFHKCHSEDVELGEEGILFSTTYLDYYYGKVFTRPSKIDSIVFKLEKINDTLIKLGKTLIVVIAPNKCEYFVEYAPSWYEKIKVHETDYELYNRLFSKTSIQVIDCKKWFNAIPKTTPYPVFTKCGIHWSLYGSHLAIDSITKYIEWKRKVDIPDIIVKAIKLTKKDKGSDADMSKTLNLIFPIDNGTMAYRETRVSKRNKVMLNLLVVGDSYFWNIIDSYLLFDVFKEHQFWYYDNEIYTSGPNKGLFPKNIDLQMEVERNDVFVLMATEPNLGNLGWGFIDRMYEKYGRSVK